MGLFSSVSKIASAVAHPATAMNAIGSNIIGDMFGDYAAGIPFIGDGVKQKFAREQFEYQKTVDERNFANQDRAFAEQQFLNRNGLTLQAAQAQKMGMNPMAMSGGSVGSVSATPVNSNASTPSPSSSSAGLIGTIISSLIGSETSKDVANINAESAKKVAEINAESAKKVADTSAGASKDVANINNLGAWNRLVEEQEQLNARNSANIASAEKIASMHASYEKASLVGDILRYNDEAKREYNKSKADVLNKAYEFFYTSEVITPKSFQSWLDKIGGNFSLKLKERSEQKRQEWFNFLKEEGENVDFSDNSIRNRFSSWFEDNFDFAPFKPVDLDEYIRRYYRYD